MNKHEAMMRAAEVLNDRMGPDSVRRARQLHRSQIIPTGIMGLDIALGIGGIPRGRITEIYGGESSGKTTLALQILAQAQRLRMDVAYVDAEHSFDPGYAAALGVDTDNLYLCQPQSGDAGLHIVRQLAECGGLGLIVVDSAAALVPQQELQGAIELAEPAAQARMMSSWLRRLLAPASRTGTAILFINQQRDTLMPGKNGAPAAVTCGGHALPFYACIRLEMQREHLLERQHTICGMRLGITVRKNKLAPPYGHVSVDCRFGTGIDTTADLLDESLRMGLLLQEGSFLRLNSVRVQGRDAMIDWLRRHPRECRQLRQGLQLRCLAGPVQPVLFGQQELPEDELLQPDLMSAAPGARAEDQQLLQSAEEQNGEERMARGC